MTDPRDIEAVLDGAWREAMTSLLHSDWPTASKTTHDAPGCHACLALLAIDRLARLLAFSAGSLDTAAEHWARALLEHARDAETDG